MEQIKCNVFTTNKNFSTTMLCSCVDELCGLCLTMLGVKSVQVVSADEIDIYYY